MQGFLLVDKPSGWTSHDVVAKCRGLLSTKKIGHAGTLDPMATGLLVLGVGACTKLLRFVQEAPKTYEATAVFGVATDTLDADGTVVERLPFTGTTEQIHKAAESFVGAIEQVPPMTSAIKIDGRKLYELAREGKEIDRPARSVVIHNFTVDDVHRGEQTTEVSFTVCCSKGTYVRTLADDLAHAVGSIAHLSALRRTANGSLLVDTAHTIEALEGAAEAGQIGEFLLDAIDGLPDLERVTLSDVDGRRVRNGVWIERDGSHVDDRNYVSMVHNGLLVAVYEIHGAVMKPAAVLPT